MAYVVQFDSSEEEIEKALVARIHVVSLSNKKAKSRDVVLAEFFKTVQNQLDAEAGSRFRASPPDAFEPIDKKVVAEAVESPEKSPVLAATSKLCFVLMPFSEKFDSVYRTLIAPVVSRASVFVRPLPCCDSRSFYCLGRWITTTGGKEPK